MLLCRHVDCTVNRPCALTDGGKIPIVAVEALIVDFYEVPAPCFDPRAEIVKHRARLFAFGSNNGNRIIGAKDRSFGKNQTVPIAGKFLSVRVKACPIARSRKPDANIADALCFEVGNCGIHSVRETDGVTRKAAHGAVVHDIHHLPEIRIGRDCPQLRNIRPHIVNDSKPDGDVLFPKLPRFVQQSRMADANLKRVPRTPAE